MIDSYKKLNYCSVAELLVLTVATEPTDGFKRFMRSAEVYGIDVKVSWHSKHLGSYRGCQSNEQMFRCQVGAFCWSLNRSSRMLMRKFKPSTEIL